MMKGQTKHLTGQVREALLALPDIVLMETLAQWLDSIDEHFLDWGDECRSALGYRIQSDETKKIYGSFEELEQAEPDGAGASWMVPDAQTLRTTLGILSIEQFYHSVIALASTLPDALTVAPLATRGTTSTGGQRKAVSPRDRSTDMLQ